MIRFATAVIAAALLAACGGPSGRIAETAPASQQASATNGADVQRYICPMHTHVVSEEPGKCPICGMDLMPVEPPDDSAADGDQPMSKPPVLSDGGDRKATPTDKGEILYYRNPMGLADTSPTPKKDWMGMDYIAVYEYEGAGGGSAAVAVAAETIQTLGVKTAAVREVDFGRTIRTFGAVADNARLLTEITSRVDGWVDDLVITAVGDEIRKGALLFRLRSPDLIAAKRDYVTALNSGSAGWAASSATRLKSLGVQEQAIAEVRASRRVDEMTPFYAERDGIVSVLSVRKGAYIRAGDLIATIADYGEVWVLVSIAEQDLPLIAAGATAMVRFPNAASDQSAIVDYVYPTVDPKTRTGKARIVLANPDLALRPGAYADVTFEIGSKARLAVPSEAILRDLDGAHVIMAMGEGRFMSMSVKTGLVAGGFTEILEGLNDGDAIVVSGQFLIDSESNLKESLAKLTAGHAGHGAASDAGKITANPSEPQAHEHQHDNGGKL